MNWRTCVQKWAAILGGCRETTEHWPKEKYHDKVFWNTVIFGYSDYWVSISKDKSNLGIFQIFIYTAYIPALYYYYVAVHFDKSFESNVTLCKQKMCTCVAFTQWELKFWQSHFQNVKLKCEIKYDGMRQLWIDLFFCGTVAVAVQTFNSFCNLNRHCCTQWGPIICMANLIYIP